MSFYDSLAATADRMIERYGSVAVLNRVVPGAYDETTGATAAATTTVYTGRGAVFGYSQREINGTDVRAGDQRVMLAPTDMVLPQTNDTLTINGTTWAVVSARQVAPGGTSVYYEAQVRGVQA